MVHLWEHESSETVVVHLHSSLNLILRLGVLGVRVQGSRFSATCVNLDGNTVVNGATIDI